MRLPILVHVESSLDQLTPQSVNFPNLTQIQQKFIVILQHISILKILKNPIHNPTCQIITHISHTQPLEEIIRYVYTWYVVVDLLYDCFLVKIAHYVSNVDLEIEDLGFVLGQSSLVEYRWLELFAQYGIKCIFLSVVAHQQIPNILVVAHQIAVRRNRLAEILGHTSPKMLVSKFPPPPVEKSQDGMIECGPFAPHWEHTLEIMRSQDSNVGENLLDKMVEFDGFGSLDLWLRY